jgi:hypothetical protein
MKWFERTGGYWLFWWSAVYFVIGMLDLFVLKTDLFPLTQIAWLCIIALPLVCNPLARWLNMKENTMFDWMKKNKMPANVVPFPGSTKPHLPKELPEPTPKSEKVSKTYYTFGLTDDNRVSFAMGYTTLTMNAAGVDQLISQLKFFRDQLHKEHDDNV